MARQWGRQRVNQSEASLTSGLVLSVKPQEQANGANEAAVTPKYASHFQANLATVSVGRMPPTVVQAKSVSSPMNGMNGSPMQLQERGERQENRTGTLDLADVRVRWNLDKPAQLNALAYVQGNDGGPLPLHPAPRYVSTSGDVGAEHRADAMGEQFAAGGFGGVSKALSGVRIHTGPAAMAQSRALGAEGFTQGLDVVLNRVGVDLNNSGDRTLLGHELGHVVESGCGETIFRKPIKHKDGKAMIDDPSGIIFELLDEGTFAGKPTYTLKHDGKIYVWFDFANIYMRQEDAARIYEEFGQTGADVPSPSEGREALGKYRAAYYTMRGYATYPGEKEAPKPSPQPSIAKKLSSKPGSNIMTFSELQARDKRDEEQRGTGTDTHVVGVRSGNMMLQQLVQTSTTSDSGGKDKSSKDESGSTQTETQEVGTQPPVIKLVLKLRPPSEIEPVSPGVQAAVDQLPQMDAMIQAYQEDLAFGNAWGDEGAAHVLANNFGVQFNIQHYQHGQLVYGTTVGEGGPVIKLIHQDDHYMVYDQTGKFLVSVPANGSCLFYAAFYGRFGCAPTANEIRIMRILTAIGLTREQIEQAIAMLIADAQNGVPINGIGPQLRAILQPLILAGIKQQLVSATKKKSSQSFTGTGIRLGGKLSLEEARKLQIQNKSTTIKSSDVEASSKQSSSSDLAPKQESEHQEQVPKPKEKAATPVLDSFVQARDEARAAQSLALKQYAEQRKREREQQEEQSKRTRAMDSFTRTRNDYQANLTRLLAEEGAKNRAKQKEKERQEKERRQQEQASKREVPPVAVAAHLMTDEEIVQFVQAHPPQTNDTVYTYAANHNEALETAGFIYTPEQMAAMNAAMEEAFARAEQAQRDRIANYRALDPRTWVMGPIQFANGLDAATVGQAVDGERILGEIAAGQLGGNTRGRGTNLVAGQRLHTHLASGSWGLAFIYVFDPNTGYVIPIVYDIAYGRKDNQYKWEKGGTGYDSQAEYK